MSAITILNDKISSVSILFQNGAGGGVIAPSGDSYTAVSSAPASLSASIAGTASLPLLVLTPLVQVGSGYTVTVSDAKGLPPVTATINIVPDPTLAVQMMLGLTTVIPQPIPIAPGP